MMAQQVPHQSPGQQRKRVKVYELRDNDWFDRGTGFCSTTTVETPYQSEDPDSKEARLLVLSEDEPVRLLLETTVTKGETFHKQQETLIVWTEPSSDGPAGGTDMALSFQETDGCASIWEVIQGVQQNFEPPLDDCVHDEMNVDMHGIVLAAAELRNLGKIESELKMISCYPNGRDSLAKFIMGKDYLHKLVSLVGVAEDLESLEDLHLLCNIVKAILLLNDSAIIDRAVSDDCIFGVMGALEYDPEFPTHKANHRAWLANRGRFKEVVPIEDAVIMKKIHQSYRLQYLKDVALARILDDPTFGVLNSLIFYTQVDIIQHIQSNTAFLGKLFGILAEPDDDMGRRKDAVSFIQQCCVIAKTLQPHQRAVLYNNFLVNGLFRVIQFAIRHPDVSVRVGGTDILMAIIEHDVGLVRQAMYRQIAEKQPPFTSALSDLLLIEFDLGVKSQVSDALKILLDPGPTPEQMMRAGDRANGERAGPQLPSGSYEPQQDLLIQRFYHDAAVKLCKPLADLEEQDRIVLSTQQASMFTYIVDLFSFFVRVHHDRGLEFLEQNNVIPRVAQLLKCREKYMQLVAVRFFRQLCWTPNNPPTAEFCKTYLLEKGAVARVLDLVMVTLPRYNLLCSACLELFEHLSKVGPTAALMQFVEENREKLETLKGIEPFGQVLAPFRSDMTNDDATTDDDESKRHFLPGNGRYMEHISIDPAEEEYMNSADDENEEADGEHHPEMGAKTPAMDGAATPRQSLVDYTSDEEGDENPDSDDIDKVAASPRSGSEEDVGPASAPEAQTPALFSAVRERTMEKRRREEEEDDAFGGLWQEKKRRNSAAVSANAAAAYNSDSSVTRPRRTSASLSRNSTPKRMQISLGALKARTEASTEGNS